MNRSYADTIPVDHILSKMGLAPKKEEGNRSSYDCPFRPRQSEADLIVNHLTNKWQDTLTKHEGLPFDLVRTWLEYQGMPSTDDNVLHWLRFNVGYPSLQTMFGLTDRGQIGDYEFLFHTVLKELSLVRYALRQGVSSERAKQVFRQVHVRNGATGNEFRALGYRNEEGGYAIYSPHVVDMTKASSVSFIRGRATSSLQVHVFKSIFDYLAVLNDRHGVFFDDDCIILHVYRCSDDAATYIRGYNYTQVCTWFDVSEHGRRATEAFGWLCATEVGLKHLPMRMNHGEVVHDA